MTTLRLADIVARLGGELAGDPALGVERIGPLEAATASTISFLSNPRYQSQLAASKAGCVIVAPAFASLARSRGSAIVTDEISAQPGHDVGEAEFSHGVTCRR